jgi:2',3'-cyclic-nucleotide 2'-phosphodiesterase (5'-nucleotidase family)
VFFLATAAYAESFGATNVKLDGAKIKYAETELGNFVADAIRSASGADIAIIHAMAFRDNALIDKGEVSEQAIRNILALPTSSISKLKLTPAQLKNVMQRSLARYPDPNNAFLQLSGMEVVFQANSKAGSARVTEIRVGGKALDFSDTATTYEVAMPTQLAGGAVGYFLEFDGLNRIPTDVTILDALKQAFAQHPEGISPKIEDRIRNANGK